MSLAAGTRIGGYEVVSELASGGMSEVYRARDLRLGREVVLKLLPGKLAADPERFRRFVREARALTALSHPNIVAVYEVDTEGDPPFLAMELVPGRTLREIESRVSLTPREVAWVGAQIARGLAKAHEEGVVHRDLKPENVILTPAGEVKILDFGLAKLLRSGRSISHSVAGQPLTLAGMVLGTTSYLSPEQARGGTVDHRADQFALGALLYELCTGRRAFAAGSGAETIARVLRDDPEPIEAMAPHVPESLRRVIRRCLEKSPERRWESTADLVRELERARDEPAPAGDGREEVGEAPASPGEPRRRSRLALWALVALLALAALALLAWLWPGS
ncbi:MAG TPA: serine/threonine-protein kinase [Thermoanaerobaculia bacterium]|nr:serine/threonine-protein kinase [Thermoanaerobaculia bacterium]